MNTYSVLDKDFLESSIYKDFILENGGFGNLKIRVFSANEAMPVSGARIIVSTMFNGDKIIFFDGVTDDSGVIEEIKLPAPKYNDDDEVRPEKRVYEVNAEYNNFNENYNVNIYDEVCTLQSIRIGER